MTDLYNGNVYTVHGKGANSPPLVFSTFKKAEAKVMSRIYEMFANGYGGGYLTEIHNQQIDVNNIRKLVTYQAHPIKADDKQYVDLGEGTQLIEVIREHCYSKERKVKIFPVISNLDNSVFPIVLALGDYDETPS